MATPKVWDALTIVFGYWYSVHDSILYTVCSENKVRQCCSLGQIKIVLLLHLTWFRVPSIGRWRVWMLEGTAFRGRKVMSTWAWLFPLFFVSQGDGKRLALFQSGLESQCPLRWSFFPMRWLGKGSRPAKAKAGRHRASLIHWCRVLPQALLELEHLYNLLYLRVIYLNWLSIEQTSMGTISLIKTLPQC